MENDFIYLDQNQALCLMHGITLLRKSNPYFDDPIAEEYENYCLERVKEIANTYFKFAKIKLLLPHGKDFKISKSLFIYLTNLTGMNIYDKELVDATAKVIEKEAEEAFKNLNNASKTI